MDIDCHSIQADVASRVGRQVEMKSPRGKNGTMLQFYPWRALSYPWREVHVEATPEKRMGQGFSVHLDFVEHYTEEKASAELRLARQMLVQEAEANLERASLIIGQEFSIDPRPKRHFVVEQNRVVAYGDWARDAKVAELIAHYITAFDPAVRAAASAGQRVI